MMESREFSARFLHAFLLFSFTTVAVGIWSCERAFGLHEVDHRFTVSGRVCSATGEPIAGTKVIVKDTKASLGESAETDGDGAFKIVLHLHNENQGDPLIVKALDFEQQSQVDFDPGDVATERMVTVNLGGACVQESRAISMVTVAIIGGGIVLAGLAGVALVRQRAKAKELPKGKTKRKH